MEPKDLKNSEELKSTQKIDPKDSEKKVTPSEEEKKIETSAEEKKSLTETPDTTPEIEPEEKEDTINSTSKEEPTEEKTSSEPEITEETPKPEPAEQPEIKEAVTEKEEVKESEETSLKEDGKEVSEEVAEKKPEQVDNEKADVKEEVAEPTPEEERKIGDKKAEKEVPKAEKVESKETPKQEPVKEKPDYSKYSQVELINALRDILDKNDSFEIKEEVEIIKSTFYRNLKADLEEQKSKFLEEGGNIEEFVPEKDPYEQDIKDLLKRFRHIRIEHNKKLEVEKEENLKLKYEVIEEIKALINNEESINKTFHDFRELQRRWREIGLVPQSEMKNLWDTYHFHVENFYDYIKINKELRDLDLKKNLEAKIKLCEKAEELLVEPSIIKAFNTLQKYHEQWREIGPVPLEQKDDIWERFKAATSKINKKHQEFFENRKLEQKKNLEAKTALCEKVEEVNQMEITNHKEWDEKSKELIELQKVWRTIGFAPRKDNNKIYERFRTECDKFFDAKREFYSKNKELQQNNLQLKLELCNEAESMKDSTDWKKTTHDFINIQKKWKEIGPVPRKHSDAVWKRFRAACDFFFDKKSEHFSSIDSEQVDNLKLKDELIKEVEDFNPGKDVDENLKILKSFQRRWTEIGHVPIKKKDDVQNRFRQAVDHLFDELNLDEEKRNLLKFRSKMSSFTESSRGQNKMRMERDKYMNKLKQLESDLVLLDNNIGFFAKSKNAESLIKDVKKKIENTKQKIEFMKEKIRVIDDLDAND